MTEQNLDLPPVVSADLLRRRLAERPEATAVVDVRWYLDGRSGRDAYLAGHLPGAVWADVDRDLAAPATPEGGRHPLPAPEDFAAALGRLGIGDGTAVIAYDDAGGSTAARLVWLMRILGSPAAVLDGGLQAWTGPLETGEAAAEPRHRTPRPWPADRFTGAEELLKGAGAAGALVLDARTHGRYTGEAPAPVDARPGHIPGARSAEWQGNLDADGRFASPERLRERFAALGADRAGGITAYCGSGVTACHDLLALERAGYSGARLYPGSWSAWGADPALPVETGDPAERPGP
ncbi:sulfurtransferase [Nocardiopsis potens]|uniref:sulfurtransferase n=1 Tax=Nocardiopsis potens TaxID=1246458 RepID=UPI0003475153|nr:sulfurtransferase [Nocardiopsis potens]